MTPHWYDDGHIVAIFFLLFIYLPAALVPIFRPQWVARMMPFRMTPERGKLMGAFMLLGFAFYVGDLLHYFASRH
jgi:hypothetical protein